VVVKIKAQREHGQAMVEMALITPIFLLLVLGLIDFAGAFHARITITNAAREGARLAGRGNIFSEAQVRQVVVEQSRGVDIAAHGTVYLTTVRSTLGGLTSSSVTLVNNGGASRLDLADLAALQQDLTSSEPDYLREEDFVVLEIVYVHPLDTGFFGATLPMSVYAAMPVSAPS
jgi:Flp pilus assembly protein TadG